jgi:hypothetical protein
MPSKGSDCCKLKKMAVAYVYSTRTRMYGDCRPLSYCSELLPWFYRSEGKRHCCQSHGANAEIRTPNNETNRSRLRMGDICEIGIGSTAEVCSTTSGIPDLHWYAQALRRALPGACLQTPLRPVTKPCMCHCIPTQKDIMRGARVDDDIIIVHPTCNEITSSISIYPDWLRLTQHHPRYQNSIGITQLYRKIVQVSVTARTPRATLARAKS